MKFNIALLATTLLFAMYGVVQPYDKIVHFLFFFSIYGILTHYYSKSYIVFLILFLFGVAVETVQVFVPGRDPDLTDILANLLGLVSNVIWISCNRYMCKY